MGLISKIVEVKIYKNVKYYEDLGYKIPKIFNKRTNKYIVPKDTKINVNVNDLQKGSTTMVEVICDCEDCKKPESYFIEYRFYNKYLKSDNKFYCKLCTDKLFATKNRNKKKIENGGSFYDWCIENKYNDILLRWNYDLNNCSPRDISYGVDRSFYFDCPNGIHSPELKTLNHFTMGQEGSIKCNQCNSLGFLYPISLDYWSDKNKKTPFEYFPFSKEELFWKCPDGIHEDFKRSIHGSTTCNFRCQKCYFLNNVGENHPAWKGGISTENERIRNSKEYFDWRISVLTKYKYKCQCCGHKKDLRVHHIINFSSNIELRFNINNGIVFCEDCHNLFHNIYGKYNNTKEQLDEFLDKVGNNIHLEVNNNWFEKSSKLFNVYFMSNNTYIGQWYNQSQCARDLNLTSGCVTQCLNNKRKSHKGYVFYFINQDPNIKQISIK